MKIAIAAPSRKVNPHEVEYAIQWLHTNGMEPVCDQRLFTVDSIFAGSDEFRAAVIQEYLDSPDIDAIWMARGGYGSIRIIDKIDFSSLYHHPTLFVGFSDVTVFHGRLQHLGFYSLHASMPYHFEDKTQESMQSLLDALAGKELHYAWPANSLNRPGHAEGILVGGNLSVLYGMIGSSSFPNTEGTILFIEEVDEYIYHVERMMIGLKRAGCLQNLKALVIGGLTQIHDNPEPFGKTVEQAIFDVVKEYDYPVCFGFPAGHQSDNLTLRLGAPAQLTVSQNSACWIINISKNTR